MKVGKSRKTKPSSCLSCGYKIDAATSVGSTTRKPKPGDFNVCISCGHIAAFADDLSLRELTDAEMVEVAGNKAVLAIQWARSKV